MLMKYVKHNLYIYITVAYSLYIQIQIVRTDSIFIA